MTAPRERRTTPARWPATCVAIGVWVVLTIAALAHGDLHEQIANVTAQIQKIPESAELYFKRAELHRLHEDWPAAAADYDRAAQLAPELSAVRLGRGKMLFASGHLDEAKAELDAFLTASPERVDAFVTRARIQAKRAEPLPAAGDFARAIALSPQPEPDFYLERAQALVAAGDAHLDDALRCLDEGMARLGNLPSLGLYAVELDAKAKRFDSALARLDRLSAISPRKEAWIERRGDLLAQAGRAEEAQQAYRAASDAIVKLPPRLRVTKAITDLEQRLNAKTTGKTPLPKPSSEL